MIIAHTIAAVAFIALIGLCLALDKMRHRYFCNWRHEQGNADYWHDQYNAVQATLTRLTDRDERGRFVRKEPRA